MPGWIFSLEGKIHKFKRNLKHFINIIFMSIMILKKTLLSLLTINTESERNYVDFNQNRYK